ncbi:hypothetical protein [Nitrospira sp. BLG_1]|uniref:hypothetical protein n=1 Tax=Nitrospira sp. BLG_1 TaxID=3395883 RepID=UPI0039BCF4ED
MNPLWNIPQLLITAWLGKLTHDQQVKYQAAVEQQIAEGKSGLQARSDAAMAMIHNDPSSAEAQAILKHQASALPGKAYASAEDVTNAYKKREGDVMGYLEGVGQQALADTNRTFSEGSLRTNLAERGLGGGGVAESLANGLKVRKGEARRRIIEDLGFQKANTLAGLTNDTQQARLGALNTAYGLDESTLNTYAGQLNNRAANNVGTYLQTTGDYFDFINNINNVPPNTAPFYGSMQSLGTGLGNFH